MQVSVIMGIAVGRLLNGNVANVANGNGTLCARYRNRCRTQSRQYSDALYATQSRHQRRRVR